MNSRVGSRVPGPTSICIRLIAAASFLARAVVTGVAALLWAWLLRLPVLLPRLVSEGAVVLLRCYRIAMLCRVCVCRVCSGSQLLFELYLREI